jgi:hypothetical protein
MLALFRQVAAEMGDERWQGCVKTAIGNTQAIIYEVRDAKRVPHPKYPDHPEMDQAIPGSREKRLCLNPREATWLIQKMEQEDVRDLVCNAWDGAPLAPVYKSVEAASEAGDYLISILGATTQEALKDRLGRRGAAKFDGALSRFLWPLVRDERDATFEEHGLGKTTVSPVGLIVLVRP